MKNNNKNLSLLPTDKPSRLYFDVVVKELLLQNRVNVNPTSFPIEKRHIYITNSEEIKEETYFLEPINNSVLKLKDNSDKLIKSIFPTCKKIILTTDQDLIKDGVQAIPDEFLEWFVKNPSCEEVEIRKIEDELISPKNPKIRFNALQDPPSFISAESLNNMILTYKYEIIIPKEEPDYTALLQPVGTRQETLEEHCSCTDECLGYLTKTCKRIEEEPKQETLEEVAERYSEHQLKGILDNLNSKQLDELEIILKKNRKLYSEEEVLAFGKSCFYKGFEKSEKDDANSFTAFREEIGSLVEQFKNK